MVPSQFSKFPALQMVYSSDAGPHIIAVIRAARDTVRGTCYTLGHAVGEPLAAILRSCAAGR